MNRKDAAANKKLTCPTSTSVRDRKVAEDACESGGELDAFARLRLQKDEAWKVNVRIQGIDLENGYLCGTMEALNVPLADTPVVTFWEGELVDGNNFTFFTRKWEATPEDDIRHWSKFPSFAPLLRWKEQYFVNVGIDCGLTIAGFYYVCFSCSDGSINGFYYDPNSSPFQKLELKCIPGGCSGYTFSSYQLL
ncbi:Vacuolar import and degradation protein [Musa troglodytarum]|uniref:Vacuolar import and degradation protein n=1 Tax=Musa troglodytarum TaxID=320322 RepID=A0A9E7HBH0_9LILI|nr:Vacuolar import and degradation protein [Musa troglodytarum]URE27039.1 Vacuolar import and degradation protein [Musa troglodytarum]